jgi:hypothetical protein
VRVMPRWVACAHNNSWLLKKYGQLHPMQDSGR